MQIPEPAVGETTEVLRQLVRIDSCNPPGREEPAAAFLAALMEEAGLEVTTTPFAPGRANVLGCWRGTGSGPALLLNGHLDTVPAEASQWRHDPHAAVIEDGILHGRGSVDMKGGVAAMVMACVALARSGVRLGGDVLFAGTAGEEVDCIGARQLLTADFGPVAALVVGEPTGLDVVRAHKGAIWLEITITGKAAHGSMPDEGCNAILAMHRIIERLLSFEPVCDPHELLGPPTLNLGTVAGGVKTNVVADRCVLTIDVRTVPGQDHRDVIEELNSLCTSVDEPGVGVATRVLTDRSAVETADDHPLIQTALRVAGDVLERPSFARGVSYFSDASVLAPGLGVPTLIFGPGDERLCHQVDEQTEVSAVARATRFYLELAQAFFP